MYCPVSRGGRFCCSVICSCIYRDVREVCGSGSRCLRIARNNKYLILGTNIILVMSMETRTKAMNNEGFLNLVLKMRGEYCGCTPSAS